MHNNTIEFVIVLIADAGRNANNSYKLCMYLQFNLCTVVWIQHLLCYSTGAHNTEIG